MPPISAIASLPRTRQPRTPVREVLVRLSAQSVTPAHSAVRLYLAEKADIAGQSSHSIGGHAAHIQDTVHLVADELGVPPEELPVEAMSRGAVVLSLIRDRCLPLARMHGSGDGHHRTPCPADDATPS